MEESFPYRLVIPKWPAESSSEASDIRNSHSLDMWPLWSTAVIPFWSLLAAVQKQILSHTFCAIPASSDWHKGRLSICPQTDPKLVPVVATIYQMTERGHFLHFYFMIFPSVTLLFHRKGELYPELLNCGMSPRGGDGLTAAESFKTRTNKSFVVTDEGPTLCFQRQEHNDPH